jgi:transposase-like protein
MPVTIPVRALSVGGVQTQRRRFSSDHSHRAVLAAKDGQGNRVGRAQRHGRNLLTADEHGHRGSAATPDARVFSPATAPGTTMTLETHGGPKLHQP